MEIWIDRRTEGIRECAASFEFAEKSIGSDCGCDFMLDGNRIFDTKSGQIAGAFVVVDGDKSQQFARSLAGSVEWIVCEFTDWAMIPLENIVSVCDGTGTKVAAKIRNHSEAQGAGFALELGVDALIVSDDDSSLLEAAQIIKSQRGEIIEEEVKASVTTETDSKYLFRKLKVVDVRDGGIGDRFCIDLTSLLEEGEGLLVSSTSKSMILVHGETIKSSFVPSRDFRINAGSPEAYVKTEKGKTKYIGELKSGENVLIVKTDGSSRLASVGRLKIEKRPFLRVEWVDEEDSTRTGHVFLQQAETVRVIDSSSGKPKSVTEIEPGTTVYGIADAVTRHLGAPISAKSEER